MNLIELKDFPRNDMRIGALCVSSWSLNDARSLSQFNQN